MRFFREKGAAPVPSRDTVLAKSEEIRVLCRECHVELCFLHGSVATARSGPLSDIDFAIYAPHQTHDAGLDFHRRLSAVIGADAVDLVMLHRASSLICMHVLTRGIALHTEDPQVLTRFRYETFRRYLDTKFFRLRFGRLLRKAVS